MSRFDNVSTKQRRIAELAKDAPDMAMDLSHHMDLEWFMEAYRRTRKDGALGLDGQSAKEYAENLEENLQSLMDRAKSGRYRAPAVRRAYIPKDAEGKEMRPIGIQFEISSYSKLGWRCYNQSSIRHSTRQATVIDQGAAHQDNSQCNIVV
jgi:hypothetical protein